MVFSVTTTSVVTKLDTYYISISTEINNCFSHRKSYVMFFRVEKADNLYVYASKNKIFKIIYLEVFK